MNNNRSTVRARTDQRNPDEELNRVVDHAVLCLEYTYIVRTTRGLEVVNSDDPSSMRILPTNHSWYPLHEHK